MAETLRIAMAQLNLLVGDIDGNLKKIIAHIETARDELHADIIVFPELALTGYPPEDLLSRDDFHQHIKSALTILKESTSGIDVIIGYPERSNHVLYNAALIIREMDVIGKYHKQCLPNYGVFDEKRYFKPGDTPCIFHAKGLPTAVIICEDLWYKTPSAQAVKAGAKLIICINASPFDVYKLRERENKIRERINEVRIPFIYVHCVGGQDEVVFDGRSMVINQYERMTHLADAFEEQLLPVDLEFDKEVNITSENLSRRLSDDARTYKALVTATRDYIEKNNFPGALVGSSGGIDSAVTLAIVVDALGPERVHSVMMPSRFTSEMSVEDAKALAKSLGIKYSVIPIEPMFQAFLEGLKEEFNDLPVDTTEENIQARCRSIILMALSNKMGKLLLTTGNKSEMAVGYATLYGDMAGGFAVLKDVYKSIVYKLALYRNTIKEVIPRRIIERPPSAELALEQIDQNTLPSYEDLDEILVRYVEHDQGVDEISRAGFPEALVKRILRLVDINEYKRRQAPPGPKITTRAFGRDRRYPITSGFSRDVQH